MTKSTSNGRSEAARGSYRSGQGTREALLLAGLRLFGDVGFKRATTRAIAAEAQVAIPAIAYHFGSKQGLHLACAQHVVDRYRSDFAAPLADLRGRLATLEGAAARRELGLVIARLTEMLLDDEADQPWIAFMLREMGGAGPAHELMLRELWIPGLSLIADAIARIRGHDAARLEERIDALLILSMPSVFGYARPITDTFVSTTSDDIPSQRSIVNRVMRLLEAL